MMGDGFAVQPIESEVYSPVSGVVTSVFETKHAIGLLADNGAEVLVHMGLDTVELKGAPFDVKVAEGDRVTSETLLAIMDLEEVKIAGKETDIIVVVTNQDQVKELAIHHLGDVRGKEEVGLVTFN